MFLIVLTVSFCTKVFNFMGISPVNSCNYFSSYLSRNIFYIPWEEEFKLMMIYLAKDGIPCHADRTGAKLHSWKS